MNGTSFENSTSVDWCSIVTALLCERCGDEHQGAHSLEDCVVALRTERNELRNHIVSIDPVTMHAENRALREILFRAEVERRMAVDALTRMQVESTAMLLRIRDFEYCARELVNCDGFTGQTAEALEVIRHFRGHIEALKDVLEEKAEVP